MKSKVKRQVAILDSEMTPREVENTVNDPQALKKLMEKKLMGKAHLRTVNAVNDIKDKYNDILVLENV